MLVEDGPFAVYDVPPGVSHDKFGRWDNDPAYIDGDYYLTADGQGGRFAQLLALQSPTMVCYGHWQSLRPDHGLGWATLQEVARRVTAHHADRLVWLRPTEIAAYRHTERHTELWPADQGFELKIPFAPPHALTFRLRGARVATLTTPSGVRLEPWRQEPGDATLFDLWPEPGQYRWHLA